LQSYDFLELYRRHNCRLQIGGDDQWGNIVAGVELIRRIEGAEVFGLTFPLVTTADGKKMGKTVNPDKTPPYELYQYFLNVSDQDVEKLLTYYSCFPIAEIKAMCKKDIISAKKLMAFEVTKKIHGEKAAIETKEMAQKLFSGSGDDAPTETIKTTENNLVDILALTSIIKSKREARELIESGAIQIDGEKVTDITATITKKEFLVKKGKKTFLKVIIKI
jgi:tyrosyl-tRNA synthetase